MCAQQALQSIQFRRLIRAFAFEYNDLLGPEQKRLRSDCAVAALAAQSLCFSHT